MPESKTFVVSYDVSDDKKRGRLARFLVSRGDRVQHSVFEITTSEERMEEIFREACDPSRFDPDTDSLRVYSLCASCREKTWVAGRGPAVSEPDAPLIV